MPWLANLGLTRGLALVLLIGIVFAADQWGLRWLRAPWSFAALGPTLTGVWEGPLRARRGAEYRILLSLEYAASGQRTSSELNLTGTGQICTARDDLYEYDLDGEASRSGDSIRVLLTYVDPVRSALGNRLEGSWSGQTLTLRPLANPFQPDGTFVLNRSLSSADPDDSFEPAELRKSDLPTFLAACARMAS
jgi:hypothetical protein